MASAAGHHATTEEGEESRSAGQSGLVLVPRIHLGLPKVTEEVLSKMEELRRQMEATPFFRDQHHRDWLHDQTLLRFLVARDFQLDKAKELLLTALAWRDLRKPFTLSATMEEMEFQGRTGKANNSNDGDAQMRYLAFNLEKALWRAEQRHQQNNSPPFKTSKLVIFMHMYNFSVFNCPSFKVTRETIQIVTACYPETMGHCIIYLPPFIFSAFFDSVKRFIDPKSAMKIMVISGDVSKGSPNDVLLSDLIGPNWKELTGAGQAVLGEGCSPGYNHGMYWAELVREDRARLASTTTTTTTTRETSHHDKQQHHGHHHGHHHHHHHHHSKHGGHHQQQQQVEEVNGADGLQQLPPPPSSQRPERPSPLDRVVSPPNAPGVTNGHGSSTAVAGGGGGGGVERSTSSRSPSPTTPNITPLSTPGASSTTTSMSNRPQTSHKSAVEIGVGVGLLSVASAFAWSSAHVPSAAPQALLMTTGEGWSSWLMVLLSSLWGDDTEPIPGEHVLLWLLSLLALCILLTYPNKALSIYDVLFFLPRGPSSTSHVTRQRSLWPVKRSQTATLVSSAAVLLSSGTATWGNSSTSGKKKGKSKKRSS